jgi:raffinose/stachyose/melibiose transport system permease protein
MLSAYAFSKINFRGRSTLFILLLGGLVLPGIALVVPLFIMVAKLGAFNTYWAVIIPLAAGAIPFNLLLAKNYMDSIQNEIVEAAEIDGCNKFQVFLRIILPLSKPISSVIVIWTFLASWNEFFLPVLFIQDPTKQTVAQVPQYFSSIYISDYPKIFAALIMISLPTLILYLVFQKNFERGLSAGAVK